MIITVRKTVRTKINEAEHRTDLEIVLEEQSPVQQLIVRSDLPPFENIEDICEIAQQRTIISELGAVSIRFPMIEMIIDRIFGGEAAEDAGLEPTTKESSQ